MAGGGANSGGGGADASIGPRALETLGTPLHGPRPQPLNTPTSVLYVGEFGQHLSVRISFFKKLVDSRATPRKSLGDPKWGRAPEVEKHPIPAEIVSNNSQAVC